MLDQFSHPHQPKRRKNPVYLLTRNRLRHPGTQAPRHSGSDTQAQELRLRHSGSVTQAQATDSGRSATRASPTIMRLWLWRASRPISRPKTPPRRSDGQIPLAAWPALARCGNRSGRCRPRWAAADWTDVMPDWATERLPQWGVMGLRA